MAPWSASELLRRSQNTAVIATFRVEQESMRHERWPWSSSWGWRPRQFCRYQHNFPNPAPIPNRSSTVQDQTRRRHDANNLLFIAYLFDADAILVHEPCRLHFQEADQLDKTHPTTRATRANLKRFVRHALFTGIPIDLNRLPRNIFSYYIHSLEVRGDAFVDVAGAIRLREMANSMRFLCSNASWCKYM